MIKKMDVTNPESAEELLRIQIPSYLVEAEIIGYFEIPPLKDTVDTLQHCEETFYGFYLKEELCGAIAIKIEKDVIDIHRLIVHPLHFRKGIAKRLLEFIENKKRVKSIIVSTGSKNVPAVNFYLKNGFQKVKEVIVNEQLSITCFEKRH